jgi:two-component system OmpR family response regulator
MAETTDQDTGVEQSGIPGSGDGLAIRVLLLDDQPENLLLRAAILHKHGYQTETASTIEEALALLHSIDIAVLDYHLGAGKFGTEVASRLRQEHPEIPIIILSATLERRFGGPEDMHLLKGHSSVEDLLAALRSFRAKLLGRPVMVDARDFFYSRISMAMGDDIVLEVLDGRGNWHYVNETCAKLLERPAKICSTRCPSWLRTGATLLPRSQPRAKRTSTAPCGGF